MTELQRQFMEETGVSFYGIPINGGELPEEDVFVSELDITNTKQTLN